MADYYTREEAARVLRVSVKRIDELRAASKLRSVRGAGGRLLIFREDVVRMYDVQAAAYPGLDRHEALEARVEMLEDALGVMKSLLLSKHVRPSLPAPVVLLQREAAIQTLAKETWTISEVTDLALWCRRLTDDEAEALFATYEERALLPFVEALQAMLAYVRSSLTSELGSLDALQEHVTAALDVLRTRTYFRYRVTRATPREVSAAVLERLVDPSMDLDRLLLGAVLAVAA